MYRYCEVHGWVWHDIKVGCVKCHKEFMDELHGLDSKDDGVLEVFPRAQRRVQETPGYLG